MIGAYIALLVAGAYFAVSPISLANFLLYLPKKVSNYSTIPTKCFGATGTSISLTTPSGKEIHGYYFQKPGATYTILLHHGQGGNLQTHFGLAKTMLLAGCSVLIYDYEGFGMSSGTPSNRAMLEDGKIALKFLTDEKHIASPKIIQCGVSLGTGVASDVAMHSACAAVILISPYTSIDEVAIERLPFLRLYPQWLFPQPDMGSLAFVKTNKLIPLLIIHGANDPLIAVQHANQLDALAQSPHRLVIEPNAHHGDFSTTFLAREINSFVQTLGPR